MDEQKAIICSKERKIFRKVLIGLLEAFLLLMATGYFLGARYFRQHFLPGTLINGIECGKLLPVSAVSLLERDRELYTLEIYGRSVNGEEILLGALTADQVGMEYTNTSDTLQEVLDKQNPYLWPKAYLAGSGETEYVKEYQLDPAKLKEALFDLEAFQQAGDDLPRDAFISGYNADTKRYEIEEEHLGTAFDTEKAYRYIVKQLERGNTRISLMQSGCYRNPDAKRNDRRLTRITDTLNRWLSACITYDWHGNTVVVDADLIHEWVGIVDGQPVLDEAAVLEFLQQTAERWNTYGTVRTFETRLGVTLFLKAKKYGWRTDTDAEFPLLLEAIYGGEQTKKEPVYEIEGYHKGSDDIGPSYVEADLTNQHLYLMQDGELILETDFVSGNMSSTPDCITPEGIFGITYKKTPAVLRGADYATPVTYWMPFYRNYGMHDATWRRTFGGDIYLTNGSHGCINLPKKAAGKIFEAVEKGFPVITYYYPEGKNPLAQKTETVDEEAEPTPGELEPTISETVQ